MIRCEKCSRGNGLIIRSKRLDYGRTKQCVNSKKNKIGAYIGPYFIFSTNSFIALLGFLVFMKFSPIKNPWKPAFLNALIVSGFDIPLSDTLMNPSGILLTKS